MDKCKWFWKGNCSFDRNVCKRHAPVVVPNPYTQEKTTITIFPSALCPCGDFEPKEKKMLDATKEE